MSIFQRLFTWGQSEANAALDKLEDPVKMAEQGIRDLKKDLQASMESLAQVKAQGIRIKKDAQRQKEIATDYERKAMMLLQKAQGGGLDMAEADRLAAEALTKRDGAIQRFTTLSGEIDNMNNMTGQLENNVQKLKSQISRWENELQTLKARSQVSTATRKLNEQLAKVDSSGTIAMLERMQDKVQSQESLAEAYGEMAQVERSVDAEIEAALGAPGGGATQSAALEDLKSRMGMGTPLSLPKAERVT